MESRRLLAAIVGRLFVDADADGMRDASESPVVGSTVYIDRNRDGRKQSSEWSTVSDANGGYRINRSALKVNQTYTVRTVALDGVSTATRRVRVTGAKTAAPDLGARAVAASTPAPVVVTPTPVPAPTPAPTPEPTPGRATIVLSAFVDANENGTRDAGEVQANAVTFFEDLNGSSLRDANEPALGPGSATITVAPGFHTFLPSFLIGSNRTGYYDFSGTFAAGTTSSHAFGFYTAPKYTGYVYTDKNKNGRRDAGEGVAGRTVFADANNNNHADAGEWRWETEADGRYELQLHPGTYTFRQVLPDGWTSSANYVVRVGGTNDTKVGGYDFTTTQTAVKTLGSITGRLFADANGNRRQDAGEGAWVGQTPYQIVFLDYDRDGQEDAGDVRATLNADGTFTFADVLPGSYHLVGVGYADTQVTTAARDVTVTAGRTTDAGAFGVEQIYRLAVESLVDVDRDGRYDTPTTSNDGTQHFGDTPVDHTIYLDANDNGKLDAGELSWTGAGRSEFGLPAGTYRFREVLPAGFRRTGLDDEYLNAGTTFAADGLLRLPADYPPINPEYPRPSMLYFLSDGVTPPPPAPPADPLTASIHGESFIDSNHNEILDAGEKGLDGQRVYLDTDDSGAYEAGEPIVVTHDGGKFDFAGLGGNSYYVRCLYAAGTAGTYNSNITDPHFIHVARGQSYVGVNLGTITT